MKLHAWSTAEPSLGVRHLSVEWAHGTKNHTFQNTEIWLYNLYFYLYLSSLLRDGGSRNKDRMSTPRVSLAIIQGGGSKEQAWPSGDGGTKAQLQAHCFSLTHKATACHPLVKLDLRQECWESWSFTVNSGPTQDKCKMILMKQPLTMCFPGGWRRLLITSHELITGHLELSVTHGNTLSRTDAVHAKFSQGWKFVFSKSYRFLLEGKHLFSVLSTNTILGTEGTPQNSFSHNLSKTLCADP